MVRTQEAENFTFRTGIELYVEKNDINRLIHHDAGKIAITCRQSHTEPLVSRNRPTGLPYFCVAVYDHEMTRREPINDRRNLVLGVTGRTIVIYPRQIQEPRLPI